MKNAPLLVVAITGIVAVLLLITPFETLFGQAAITKSEFEAYPSSLAFAPPYDVFNNYAPVVQVAPAIPTTTDTVRVRYSFLPTAKAQLVHNKIYVYNAVGRQWQPYTLTGSASKFPAFITQPTAFTIPANALAVGDNYVATYFCTDVVTGSTGTTYQCGCSAQGSCGKWNVERITVVPVSAKPTVKITAPNAGSTVSGVTTVSVSVTNMTNESVQLQVGNTQYAMIAGASHTFTYSWNTSGTANGGYNLTAIAKNTTKTVTSSTVSVTVNNVAAASCGNGVLDSGEQCDGTNYNGKQCSDLGFGGGSIGCTATCVFNTASCTGIAGAQPSVTINQPLDGASVGGTVKVNATVVNVVGPTVTLYVNSAIAGTMTRVGTSGVYQYDWITGASNSYTLYVKAANATTTVTSNLISVDVFNQAAWVCDISHVSDSCPANAQNSTTYNCIAGFCREITTNCGASTTGKYCTSSTTLASGYDCTGSICRQTPSACGNGNLDSGEQCDTNSLPQTQCTALGKGYASGTLSCTKACSYNESNCQMPVYQCNAAGLDKACTTANAATGFQCVSGMCCRTGQIWDGTKCNSCGNGQVEGAESCDGTNLNGKSCTTVGGNYVSGTLACKNDCTYDTAGCNAVGATVTIDPISMSGRVATLRAVINNPQPNQNGITFEWKTSTTAFQQAALSTSGTATTWTVPASVPLGTTVTVQARITGTTTVDTDTATVPACISSSDCNDNNACTVDTCNQAGTELAGCSQSAVAAQCPAASAVTCGAAITPTNSCGSCSGTGTLCTDSRLSCTTNGCKDTQAPAQVTGLNSPGKTTTSISLGWNAASDNVGVTGYRVVRNGVLAFTNPVPGWTDTGLTQNTQYTYTVAAVDAAGNQGAASTALSVTTTAACVPTTCAAQGKTCGTISDGCGNTLTCGGACPVCGNGNIETGEQCDGSNLAGKTCAANGFAGGTLRCSSSCQFDESLCTNCGNGVVNSNEQCDGTNLNSQTCATQGYYTGTLICTSSCTFNYGACTNCGNGLVNVGEGCDGSNFGGKTCATYGYNQGSLSCSGMCTVDSSGCSNGVACTQASHVGQQCAAGANPSAPYSCSGGTCTWTCSAASAGATCPSGASSSSGYGCVNNICRSTTPNCNGASEVGKYCTNGATSPYTCQNGVCTAPSTVSCSQPSHVGQTCSPGATPPAGYTCESGTCQTCLTQSACPNPSFYSCNTLLGNPAGLCPGLSCGRGTNANFCPDDGNACTNPYCTATGCANQNAPDGTTCSGGTCQSGSCVQSCGGCPDSVTWCGQPAYNNCGQRCGTGYFCDDPNQYCDSTGCVCPDGTRNVVQCPNF